MEILWPAIMADKFKLVEIVVIFNNVENTKR